MAVYYVSSAAVEDTAGNNGSWANPYHISDVFRAGAGGVIGPVSETSDQNTLIAGDAIGIITGTSYTLGSTSNVRTPVVNGSTTSPIMVYAQDPTTEARLSADRAVIDGTNLAGNEVIIHNQSYWHWYSLELKNGPSFGLRFNSGASNGLWYNCHSYSHSSNGLWGNGSASKCSFYYCQFFDNGGQAIYTTADYYTYYRCIFDLDATDKRLGVGDWADLIECIIKVPDLDNANTVSVSGTYYKITNSNIRIAETANSANALALFNSGATLTNNIITGNENVGSGDAMLFDPQGVIGPGNVFVDSSNMIIGTAIGTDLSLPRVTTDPVYTDAANGDFTPTADLSGIAVPEAIYAETDWILPGAFPATAVAGTAGASSTFYGPIIQGTNL